MTFWHHLLLVGCGGGLGAVLRHLVGSGLTLAAGGRWPVGTLVVNLVGCFAAGCLAGAAQRFEWVTPEWRLFLMTGVLGGYTTFSAFGVDTLRLLEKNDPLSAGLYVAGSVAGGLVLAAVGYRCFTPG